MNKWPSITALLIVMIVGLPGCNFNQKSVPLIESSVVVNTGQKIAHLYGAPSACVIKAVPFKTLNGKQAYDVVLVAPFKYGGNEATMIEFSMLQSGERVWDLKAFDDTAALSGQKVPYEWTSNEVHIPTAP